MAFLERGAQVMAGQLPAIATPCLFPEAACWLAFSLLSKPSQTAKRAGEILQKSVLTASDEARGKGLSLGPMS